MNLEINLTTLSIICFPVFLWLNLYSCLLPKAIADILLPLMFLLIHFLKNQKNWVQNYKSIQQDQSHLYSSRIMQPSKRNWGLWRFSKRQQLLEYKKSRIFNCLLRNSLYSTHPAFFYLYSINLTLTL